jgi:membrane protease YdiL (CAAX protease family)
MKDESVHIKLEGIALALGVMLLYWIVQWFVALSALGAHTLYLSATGAGQSFSLSMMSLPWVQISVALVSSLVVVLLLWAIRLFRFSQVKFRGLPVQHAVLLGILLIAFSIGITVLTEFTGLPDYSTASVSRMLSSPWGVLAIALIGPIGEEVAFRGVILQKLMDKGWSAVGAILISGIIFGLVHANPNQIFFACILGYLLGWVYVRTQSVVPCIGLHILNNLLSVILYYTMDDESASTAEQFGLPAAIGIMVIALIISAVVFYYLRPRLKKMF